MPVFIDLPYTYDPCRKSKFEIGVNIHLQFYVRANLPSRNWKSISLQIMTFFVDLSTRANYRCGKTFLP